MVNLAERKIGARNNPVHFNRWFEGALPMATPVIFYFFLESSLLDFANSRELLMTFNLYEKYYITIFLQIKCFIESFNWIIE